MQPALLLCERGDRCNKSFLQCQPKTRRLDVREESTRCTDMKWSNADVGMKIIMKPFSVLRYPVLTRSEGRPPHKNTYVHFPSDLGKISGPLAGKDQHSGESVRSKLFYVASVPSKSAVGCRLTSSSRKFCCTPPSSTPFLKCFRPPHT